MRRHPESTVRPRYRHEASHDDHAFDARHHYRLPGNLLRVTADQRSAHINGSWLCKRSQLVGQSYKGRFRSVSLCCKSLPLTSFSLTSFNSMPTSDTDYDNMNFSLTLLDKIEVTYEKDIKTHVISISAVGSLKSADGGTTPRKVYIPPELCERLVASTANAIGGSYNLSTVQLTASLRTACSKVETGWNVPMVKDYADKLETSSLQRRAPRMMTAM